MEVTKTTEVTIVMPNVAMIAELKGLKQKYKATAAYRTQEEWFSHKGKPIRCFYLGLKEIPSEDGEPVNCAVFAAEDGIFLAAQHVLLEAVKPLEAPTPLEITFREKRKNKTGEGYTNLFDVVVLGDE